MGYFLHASRRQLVLFETTDSGMIESHVKKQLLVNAMADNVSVC